MGHLPGIKKPGAKCLTSTHVCATLCITDFARKSRQGQKMVDLDMNTGQIIFCLIFGGLAFLAGALWGYTSGHDDATRSYYSNDYKNESAKN